MSVQHVSFEVTLYSDDLRDVEELRKKLYEAAVSIHPDLRYDSDVEVDIIERVNDE